MPKLLALAGAAAVALAPLPAAATVYTFTLTGHDTATFSLPSSPKPQYQDPNLNYFQLFDVSGRFTESGDMFTSATLTFYGNGGFDINSNTDFSAEEFYGPAVFRNGVAAPIFVPGAYDVYEGAPGGVNVDHLVIARASAAVPEPATWAMTIVGFGALGAAARYRKTRVRLTYAA